MRSTKYIFTFVAIMTVVVALILSLMAVGLKPIHDEQEAIFNKKAVLAAIETELGKDVKARKMADDKVLNIFDTQIKQQVIDYHGNEVNAEEVEAKGYKGGLAEHVDMGKEKKKSKEDRIFPLYTYTSDTGKKSYIVTVIGNGLWDEIWGNIALEDDLKTVVGASFGHAGETPGLGAEIKDNTSWVKQFQGKKIYDKVGNYTSVNVRKGGARNPIFEVDAISGATVTCDGVTDMLYDGIQYYLPYLKTLSTN
ncbi:MAG: NADH:ubiquinone reductase (Na(+)-transporting) subunit C [Saprospiraceae bacterium]